MRQLSKSKLLAYRQCPKRLWLEVHYPELRQDSDATQASFDSGHQVGYIARKLYDLQGDGVLLDPKVEGFEAIFLRTKFLMQKVQPIFEGGFSAEGAFAFADVLLPVWNGITLFWRMVEVKSSTSIKDYHRDDAAIQSFIARSSGVLLSGISIAHIDSNWVYPGGEDYQGLLIETDISAQAFGRSAEVRGWIDDAKRVVSQETEPDLKTGKHCNHPFECGFIPYCQGSEPQAKHPIQWLPDRRCNELNNYIAETGTTELSDLPDELLTDKQQRVKAMTISGQCYFDQKGAANDLSTHELPAFFLDFETIWFAVPIWKGTRPYQQIPFQFSLQHLSFGGKLEEKSFLDTSGADPSLPLAEALIAACGQKGPIFAYNAGFEKSRILELAKRFPSLETSLKDLCIRLVDLLPIARERFYHPSQQGSWSIKAVLPALCPDLCYDKLDGVQNGGMAMHAFLEALDPQTTPVRKCEIESQLRKYCALDTYAMVRLWSAFTDVRLNA
jgi:hypothetical protein